MTELDTIEEELKQGWTNKDHRDYLLYLATVKARINELKAKAESEYLDALEELKESGKTEGLKQYEYKELLSVYLKKETLLKYRLDRISSTIEHQAVSLRSILFLTGQEMRLTGEVF